MGWLAGMSLIVDMCNVITEYSRHFNRVDMFVYDESRPEI